MSQARVYITKKVRKDWTCGKCGAAIRKGIDGRKSFAVGFRGYEQTRCMKPECSPTRSELESSAVAAVYAAIDGIDFNSLTTLEDLESARDDVVAACEEVADEYESNEMYEINMDLQERAEQVRSAGEELSNWSPDDDEPEDEIDCSQCNGTGEVEAYDEEGEEDGTEECEECGGTGKVPNEDEDAHEEWLTTNRETLEAAMDEMELP